MSRAPTSSTVLALALITGCASTHGTRSAAPAGAASDGDGSALTCPLDAAKHARGAKPRKGSPACAKGDLGVCADDCDAGAAQSCRMLGYGLERAKQDDGSNRAFHRACAAGDMNSCTNLGAHAVIGKKGGVDAACALALFRFACDGGDHWGCGMLGRVAVEGIARERDVTAGRAALDASCDALGGFPCELLGRYWHEGAFGEVDEVRSRRAMQRACETGMDDACAAVGADEGGTKL